MNNLVVGVIGFAFGAATTAYVAIKREKNIKEGVSHRIGIDVHMSITGLEELHNNQQPSDKEIEVVVSKPIQIEAETNTYIKEVVSKKNDADTSDESSEPSQEPEEVHDDTLSFNEVEPEKVTPVQDVATKTDFTKKYVEPLVKRYGAGYKKVLEEIEIMLSNMEDPDITEEYTTKLNAILKYNSGQQGKKLLDKLVSVFYNEVK